MAVSVDMRGERTSLDGVCLHGQVNESTAPSYHYLYTYHHTSNHSQHQFLFNKTAPYGRSGAYQCCQPLQGPEQTQKIHPKTPLWKKCTLGRSECQQLMSEWLTQRLSHACGSIHWALPFWDTVLEDHPDRSRLLAWLKHGVRLSDFGLEKPISGEWNKKVYRSRVTPPDSSFPNRVPSKWRNWV